jgi:hypothetical protein
MGQVVGLFTTITHLFKVIGTNFTIWRLRVPGQILPIRFCGQMSAIKFCAGYIGAQVARYDACGYSSTYANRLD